MSTTLTYPPKATYTVLFLGFTAILIGYLMVWLPGPGAGLSLLGFEIGEWIKFLGVGPRRDLFYLPPIVLGLLLALLTGMWPNDRWQTWVARLLAIAVSLLSFPAVAAITTEPPREWITRLLLIGLVCVVVLLSSAVARHQPGRRWIWGAMAIVSLFGAFAPTWQYLAVRPVVVEILQRPVGIGPGVWLNLLGCLTVAAVTLLQLWGTRVGRN